MNLPPVNDKQLQEMNEAAEKKTIAFPPLVEEQEAVVAPEESTIDNQETVEQEPQVAAAPEPEPVKEESSKEMNLRILRERAEKAEREKEQLMRFVSERLPKQQQQQTAAQEEDLEFSIAPDDLAEGKHLAKLNKKIKLLENQIKQGNQQSVNMSTEARLKAQYPDFEKVVSQSNIASLSEMYPEMAKTIGESTDLYNKAVSAYTMIKKLGIHNEEANLQDRVKIQANAAKPRPLASISPQQGGSPMTKVNAFENGLTDELAKSLRKEMADAMKGR